MGRVWIPGSKNEDQNTGDRAGQDPMEVREGSEGQREAGALHRMLAGLGAEHHGAHSWAYGGSCRGPLGCRGKHPPPGLGKEK